MRPPLLSQPQRPLLHLDFEGVFSPLEGDHGDDDNGVGEEREDLDLGNDEGDGQEELAEHGGGDDDDDDDVEEQELDAGTIVRKGAPKERGRSRRGGPKFECHVLGCGQQFRTMAEFTRHQKTHHQDLPNRCETPGCGQSFAKPGQLKVHQRSHTTTRECPMCHKAYKNTRSFEKHMKNEHSASDDQGVVSS